MARRWIRLRQLVQYLALALFLYLFVSTTPRGGSPVPVNLFSRLDPLLALASMLAARRVISTFAPAIITVLATLALGRVWCGWLCPLGTVLDLFGPVEHAIPQWVRQAKHFLLFIILFAALLANLTLIFLDPITISLRALAVVISPLPLVVILALNLIAKRFWCRYLCPLGALLGLLSKVAWIKRRVSEDCAGCGLCVPVCPMGAIAPTTHSSVGFTSDPGECIQCMNCLAPCPVGTIQFGSEPGLRGYEYDPSRRQLLASLATSIVGVGLLRTGSLQRKSPYLLRPPGARPETVFLVKCVRCGQCIKVCPNSALRPTLLEAGLQGIWTPVLVPRLGHCDYFCNACGRVCPSGAIPSLSLEEKKRALIGTAHVDRDRCLSCLVCTNICPVGAIEAVKVKKEGVVVRFPQVIPDLCTGCGACEYICPVEGEAAIRVYAPA